MTSTNLSKSKSGTPSKLKSVAKPKKIPRPANAFLIYRREHAKAYPGLVATELSTKLAQAWKDETPERQALYFRKAEKLKQEHAINYPNWKFTPRKRGTGKRALQLAAIASASKKAAEHPVVFLPASNGGLMKLRSPRVFSTTLSSTTYSASPSAVAGIKAEPSDGISLLNRPRRNAQRPQRYSPASPYSYAPSSSSVASPTNSSAADYCSSSLFFHSDGAAQWSTMQTVPSQYQESIHSPTSSTTSYSSRFSADGNCYGENDDGEYGEVDINVKTEEDTSTTQISEALCQLLKQECERNGIFSPHCMPALHTSPYQEEPCMFSVATFPSLLSMESFEPECLARDDAQWAATTNALCPIMSTPTMSNCSSVSSSSSSLSSTPSSSSSSSYGYSTPSYEGCSALLHFPMDINTSAALMPTPLTTPLYPPVLSSQHIRSSASSAQPMQLSSFPFEISTPMRIPLDLMMSPALSSCSDMSPKPQPEAQNYIANALEWL